MTIKMALIFLLFFVWHSLFPGHRYTNITWDSSTGRRTPAVGLSGLLTLIRFSSARGLIKIFPRPNCWDLALVAYTWRLMCREDKFVSLQIHGNGKEILSSERYSKHFNKKLKNRTFLIIFLRTEFLNFEIDFFQKYLFGNNLAVFWEKWRYTFPHSISVPSSWYLPEDSKNTRWLEIIT